MAEAIPPAERARARRIFEETLHQVQQQYAPTVDVRVEAWATDRADQKVLVARYTIYVDGRIACCEMLDEELWPSL